MPPLPPSANRVPTLMDALSRYPLVLCLFALGLLLGSRTPATAQAPLPLTPVSLASMDAFQAAGDNWQLAGSVDSRRDEPGALTAAAGTGILVNRPTEAARDNLFTAWEHGDIELELDVLIPNGSNSGIYLQGRYEVQLFDSWGIEHPRHSDCGGIYERWDESRPEGRRGYEGQPPRFNASRAPGLWQHVKILFHAPRFDASGRKIANARFGRVELNGVVIHENVEVTGPTRAAAFTDEQPTGPLMLQGDHGPVAFRHLRYKRYTQERVRLRDVRYRFYEGYAELRLDVPLLQPTEEGTAAGGITWNVGTSTDTFVVTFEGLAEVPTSGPYRFVLALDWITGDPHFQEKTIGGGLLQIDGRTALEHDGRLREAAGQIDLEAGIHLFSLTYFKSRPWHGPMMALYVEGPDTPLHVLNDPTSLPKPSSVGAIAVEPAQDPLILRSFLDHRGTKRTHAASVGDPAGIHYSLDLSQAALLYVWRGPFLETTSMWESRGSDQLAVPEGSFLDLPGGPSLALLDDPETPWPDSVDQAAPYRFRGYDLDGEGRPTFRYNLGPVAVEDRLVPGEQGRYLTRHQALHAEQNVASLWCRVAAGSAIIRLADGTYAVDDRTYYVEVGEGSAPPVLRTTAAGQELLVPVRFQGSEAEVTYSIIW